MSTAVQTLKLTEIFVDNKETNKLIDVHVLSQPSPLAFSLAPLSVRSQGKSGRENAVLGVYLSVTSQLTVECRIDRAENA